MSSKNLALEIDVSLCLHQHLTAQYHNVRDSSIALQVNTAYQIDQYDVEIAMKITEYIFLPPR